MKKEAYKDEYWDQALEVLQMEENWSDALKVLKREERKVFARRLVPVLAILLFTSSVFWIYTNKHEAIAAVNQTELDSELNKNVTKAFNVDSSKSNEASEFLTVDQAKEQVMSTNQSDNQLSDTGNNKGHQSNGSAKSQTQSSVPSEAEETGSRDNNLLGSKPSNQGNLKDRSETMVDRSTDTETINLLENSENSILNQDQKNNTGTNAYPNRNDIHSKPASDIWKASMNFLPILYPKQFSVKAKLLGESSSIQPWYIRKRNTFKVLFGTSQFNGYGSSGERFINPVVGMEYERVFNEKWSFNTGISYYQIAGMAHQATFSEKEFGFGMEEKLTTFTSRKLHYLFVPLTMDFQINKYHSLHGGIAWSYLLTNESSVSTNSFENGIQNGTNTEVLLGYASGYKSITTSLLLGYEFSLSSKSAVGITYQHGLSDIIKTEIYDEGPNNRDSRLQVVFKRNIKL